MRVLTIWQPYASLIVCGLKKFETRSWPTPYRGTLLIHAAKKWDDDLLLDTQDVGRIVRESGLIDGLTDAQREHLCKPVSETIGRVLGAVELTDCQPMMDGGSDFENAVGSFGAGRYGWKCSSPSLFPLPFVATGKQRLWIPDEYVMAAASAQLKVSDRKIVL